MGTLKPGVTYVYERDNGVVYSREFGAAPDTRQIVGWEYDPVNGHKIDPEEMKRFDVRKATGDKELADHNEWIKIRLAGKTNPALQQAIDRVKILYRLSVEKYE
jgi:hypothetical protein